MVAYQQERGGIDLLTWGIQALSSSAASAVLE